MYPSDHSHHPCIRSIKPIITPSEPFYACRKPSAILKDRKVSACDTMESLRSKYGTPVVRIGL